MNACTEEGASNNVHQRLYKPVSATEFRVVHLLPGKFHDEIKCVLETRSFHVKARYKAISYQWGDESPSDPRTPTKTPPHRTIEALAELYKVLKERAKSYPALLRVPPRFLAGWILCQTLLRLPLGPPPWVPPSIPRDVYIAFLSIIFGYFAGDFLVKVIMAVIELSETKPWAAAYDLRSSRTGQQGFQRPSDFETLQVTTNLQLALQYLRQNSRVRTLWIDALCTNQRNEDEKMIQIQRMEWIYANASLVVVWLGDCHGLGATNICAESTSPGVVRCEHETAIQAAFGYIWTRSGWRILCRWYFDHHEQERFQEASSGLCELARRGWWERLWVVQEIALATRPVQLQCGSKTCDFEDFANAAYTILQEYVGDKAIAESFRSSRKFDDTIKEFRYSLFHDRGGLFVRTASSFMMKVMGMFFRDIGSNVPRFHDLPFAQRLQLILLKSAGRFKCRDDRDRLYVVLGIAGGATTESVSNTASLIGTISSPYFSRIIYSILDQLWVDFKFPVKVVYIVFAVGWSIWEQFYDFRAKHWSINRPYYVVAGYREAIKAVTTKQGKVYNRAEFFTALAKYLAKETGSLALLDVANCGQGEEEEMPSWVPKWTQEISRPAYEFTNRIKSDEPPDSIDLDYMQSSPWLGAFEKVLVLSSKEKFVVSGALKIISIMYQIHLPALTEEENKFIANLVRLIETFLDIGLSLLKDELLKEGCKTVIYSYDVTVGEMGHVIAREAVKGDQLVFVPGCFHHLVLRAQRHRADRWKLVGLVAMSKTTQGRKGYTKSEWAQLLEEGAVYRYSIE
ncbi:uncharacterized protein LY89DRAFT_753346 [Mollisia scopiformis]|uniref:Heterokaryon incompatibility domain-containing protein n=1 Tax=Mollisia scopiformis TaxID=149040 RepID=A0A194X186_MOLSC|nr:uncharacterized protein LY89DRAFT_753346 [Mollisia scopiformis]KUJ13955.1 hypothetical protein LY89DRAFT_753346 [Mollisia scopiformis]